jgi:O-antigen ligase
MSQAGQKLPAVPLLFAAALAVPVLLPIPGFENVPPFAMAAALGSIPFLFIHFCLDSVASRPGSALRLGALLYTAAAIFSWLAGIVLFGPDAGATLSFISWISLVSVAVAGQTLLTSAQRVSWLLNTWVTYYALVSFFAAFYLIALFGSSLITSTSRTPFQVAMRDLIPSWPNYFGVAIAIAVCIVYGRIRSGASSLVSRLQLVALLIGLFLTFSRGSYLACIAGMFVMTFVGGSRLRAMLMLFVGLIATFAAVIFIPTVNFLVMASFRPGTSQNLGLIERLAFQREALLLWWDHPMTGIGFRRFADFADMTLVYADGGQQASALGSVHNEYVTTLLKGGWLGAASLLVFLVLAFRVLKRTVRHEDLRIRQFGIVGFGVAAVLLTACMATESLRSIAVSGVFWALMGALDRISRPLSPNVAQAAQ